MDYDKPYKTFNEQVDHLEKKYGLIVDDREFAINALRNLSYYDLINGYKECFQYKNQDRFIPGTTIEHTYAFHEFDRDLQNILFKYSIYVETRFKNILAHVVAEQYGVDHHSYLMQSNYTKPRNRRQSNLRKTLFARLNYIASEEFVDNPSAHYRKRHNHIPPWVLFKNATWSDCSDLYKIMQSSDKQMIADEVLAQKTIRSGYKKKLLSDSLYIVRKCRNSIAHSSKFIVYSAPKNKSLILNELLGEFEGTLIYRRDFKHTDITHNIFSMILGLVLLLGDRYRIERLGVDLAQVITHANPEIWKKYSDVSGIPHDLIGRLLKYIDKISNG